MTKNDILNQLKAMNAPQGSPVLVHSSLRAVGTDAAVLLDALIEYFTKDGGLLCVPTHTWHNLKKDIVLDMASNDNCLGALSTVALNDGRAVRSQNPTHSMVIFGNRQKALEFIKDDEFVTTPTAPKSCYGKIYEQGGYILLIGVAQNRNTYLHAVDEILQTPNRMEKELYKVKIKTQDGNIITRDFKLFYTDYSDDICTRFVKYDTAFRYHRAITDGFIGNAPSQLCDAIKMKDVIELIYNNCGDDPLKSENPIPQKWYC